MTRHEPQYKASWYWNRLRLMSVPEMGHRLIGSCQNFLQKHGLFTAASVPEPTVSPAGFFLPRQMASLDPGPYLGAADAILEGRLEIFSRQDDSIDNSRRWNRDCKTGTVAPLTFGRTLDYRDPDLVGDIKYLWEPNRHLHLVTLGQAYRLTRDERYLDGMVGQLDSWFSQCPYLLGPNWSSPLELAIRLINWSLVWNLIDGADSVLFQTETGKALLRRWLNAIYQHAHFIRNHFSRYSSANNHLIGEAAGLFIATCSWPFWKKFERWREVAHRELTREALRQNGADGVNREQAISYQQFVLDFLLLSVLAGRSCGVEFPPEYWQRMESMLEFLGSVMDVGGNVPMFGDADDGFVVKLSQEPGFCAYRSLLATGTVLFDRGDFKAKAGRLDDKTRWLLGKEGEKRFETISMDGPGLPVRKAYPEGGYYVLGTDFETSREIRLVVDAGPVGYLSLAAHGHADALSFVLSIAGREILIDPGTFAYHSQLSWRDYFRGTSAHNTLRVDGRNQSVIGGSFMWLQKAKAACSEWESSGEEDRFAGTHDGYLRLADPLRHRREIYLRKKEGMILVIDTLECRAEHLVERFWHFSEDCRVTQEKSGLLVKCPGVEVHFSALSDEGGTTLYRGDPSFPCGWVSRRYDFKEPITTAVFRNRIKGSTCLKTEIVCIRPGDR